MKPVLQKLWNVFPDHEKYPTLKDLYTWLGGAAQKNISNFGATGNTCASRLSVAFNHGGASINRGVATAAGALVVSAADGSQIIYRVAHFRKYLQATLGKPSVDLTSPFDSAFRGKRGIIAFSVNWHGASGYIALWDGTRYREPHDDYASYVNSATPSVRTFRGEFWELI